MTAKFTAPHIATHSCRLKKSRPFSLPPGPILHCNKFKNSLTKANNELPKITFHCIPSTKIKCQERIRFEQKNAAKIMFKLSFSSIVLSLTALTVCFAQFSPSAAENLSSPSSVPSQRPVISNEPKQEIIYGRFYLKSQPLWEANFKAPVAWMSTNNRLLNVGSLFAKRTSTYDAVSGIAIWNTYLSAPLASPPLHVDNTLIATAKDCSIYGIDSVSGENKYWILPFPYDRLVQESKKKRDDSVSDASSRLTAAQAMAKAKEKAEERQFRNQLLRIKFNSLPRLSYNSPCQGEDKVVCLSGDGVLTQFSSSGEKVEWNLLKCSGLSNKLFVSSPAIEYFKNKNSEYLYAISLNGRLWSINLSDPSSALSQQVGSGSLEFRQPLRIVRNFLYLTATNGALFCYALGADSESDQYFQPKFVWRYQNSQKAYEQTNAQGRLINAPSFDLHKPRCFFVNGDAIVSLASLSGQLLWRYKSSKTLAGPTLYWNGNVLVATESQTLLVLDAESGQLKREYALPFVPSCPLLIDDRYLYLGGSQGQVACLEIENTSSDS